MPRATDRLTDTAIRNAAAREAPYYLTDGKGLRLLVTPAGGKLWRFSYRFNGKQNTLGFGTYPQTSLKEARKAVAAAKAELANGVDPSDVRKAEKAAAANANADTFAALAQEWFEHARDAWDEDHAEKLWSRLEANALPHLGAHPIGEITPMMVIAMVQGIEARGALDVAQRVLQDVRRVFRHGIQRGRLLTNPAADLQGVLKPRKRGHRDALPLEELPAFMAALDSPGPRVRRLTILALRLLLLTFVRSGELRGARWEEFDLDGRVWRVPAERMKMKAAHIVPLSDEALAVLGQIQEITGHRPLLFPSETRPNDCMSDNTLRRAMFRLGWDGNTDGKTKAVPHGMRALASSTLNESGFNVDAIERQLAHVETNAVRAAYNRAEYLEERRRMMEWWGCFIAAQARGATVIPFRSAVNRLR